MTNVILFSQIISKLDRNIFSKLDKEKAKYYFEVL